ncbi:MAG: type II secretion system protein [Phycisphaerae bacterium]|nr:type II secretion system protein [Phycisphaerae bacterium]
MMKREALTLVEVLVIVAITALLITILIAALARPPMSDMELCAAQLKGIGTAIATYANENAQVWPLPTFDAEATIQYVGMIGKPAGPNGTAPTVASDTASTALSTTRCLWMLVLNGSCVPGWFICPASKDAKNTVLDPENYYDFASYTEISYGLQVPWSETARPTTDRDPRMPLAADKGPFGAADTGDGGLGPKPEVDLANIHLSPSEWQASGLNSPNHGGFGKGEGQNILYADFHVEFIKNPIDGIGRDNIYTAWETADASQDQIIKGNGPAKGNDHVPMGDTDTLIYP